MDKRHIDTNSADSPAQHTHRVMGSWFGTQRCLSTGETKISTVLLVQFVKQHYGSKLSWDVCVCVCVCICVCACVCVKEKESECGVS